MSKKTKLELTWIGKDERPRLEPRILLEDPELSYHASHRSGAEHEYFDNRLIFGDNLLALKALEQEFTEKVKCIYIDPPFNTGQALEHYEDGLEHSIWLSLISERIRILHRLLSEDGTLCVHIDDTEVGYLIVVLDELFGRDNRMSIVTFKQGAATGHKSINAGCVTTTNFVLVYAKDKKKWQPNRLYTARERDKRYTGFIVNRDAPFTEWKIGSLVGAVAKSLGLPEKGIRKAVKDFDRVVDDFVSEHPESVIRLARPSYDGVSSDARALIDLSRANPSEIYHLERTGYSDMYFIRGERILFYSDKLKLIDGQYVAGEPLTTLWDDLLSNNLHKEGGVSFPKGKKPEALVKRVIELSTGPGDLVLDSFAGSGTTGAVAHKMGRRWIMVELGEHCHTHIVPRMKQVVDGTDPSGISRAVSWKGGGGFRYYRLAPSLLERDRYGHLVINPQYNAEMLAEAMCKHEGFTYAPSPNLYWQHGRSTERDFIYITTQTLTREQLAMLSEDVGLERSLLVCCSAWIGDADEWPNLSLKKIPDAVEKRCEWGRDDYSLRIRDLPTAEPELVEPSAGGANGTGRKAPPAEQPTLFAQGGEA
jgi:adenine-specific DNA-methyltransferase